MWVPHKTTSEADWWVVPVVAMIITVLGFVYWSSLVGYRKLRKTGEVFLIDRKPRSEHIEECQRDVLVSEWLEQKWLSQATGTGPEVFLKRLKKRKQSDPNVSNTPDLHSSQAERSIVKHNHDGRVLDVAAAGVESGE